jgi:hypothetical protein
MASPIRLLSTAGAFVCLVAVAPALGLSGGLLPDPAGDDASCMGSGSAFYGVFAPQQRAFVAEFVIDQAADADQPPGETYQAFAQEKEGGSIPTPCGTRIE